MTQVRKGQAPDLMAREEFGARFRDEFVDPAFRAHDAALKEMEAIAWDAYREGRKAPFTTKAGPEFADPEYQLSDEWRATRDKVRAADARRRDPASASRVLVICGSSRNDGTCPGEMSKTYRLTQTVCKELRAQRIEDDLLDLSRITSDPLRRIHPCKGCVGTAMPLCHWPCSCYPNHSTRQTNDWMAEIYERWSAAHGVILLTPVYWYQVASPLKLMIDRLVCADGGNPDQTTTRGKNVEKAKALLGCESNVSCLADLGNGANAKYIISGSVGSVGGKLTVNLTLIDTATAQPKNRATGNVNAAKELAATVRKMVVTLFGWSGGAEGPRFSLPSGQQLSFAVLDLVPTGGGPAAYPNVDVRAVARPARRNDRDVVEPVGASSGLADPDLYVRHPSPYVPAFTQG